ncbi:alpha/beta hydrolase [Microlunatus elymi]|uniref:Alpha/beta hydrolase n=1 Tax=Microlunatus elymi TaxID=2596828 RepID=A0A516Q236_9ACTN|nr:alpha/beta hydrolase [Microlunatus elymi]QDP97493.1 alpha/beta hydrolase [Microlunatus elymi]
MARVIMVPGLAVRRYLQPAADALRSAGHSVALCPPLGWPAAGSDLDSYGRRIADQTWQYGPADMLVGMSVGTQGAVAAVRAGADVGRLLLISPTIDPQRRSVPAMLAAWLGGEQHPDSPRLRTQSQDWVRAGLSGIYRGLRSAIDYPLERELPQARQPVTIVHGDADRISPLPYAADLADRSGAELLIMPDAPHSWPVSDGDRFVELISTLTRSTRMISAADAE